MEIVTPEGGMGALGVMSVGADRHSAVLRALADSRRLAVWDANTGAG